MPAKQKDGEQKSEQQTKPEQAQKPAKLTLLDLKHVCFQSGERTINVEEASDAEFDAFIRQFVNVGWSLEERRDALNLALEKGTLALPEQESTGEEQLDCS